MIEINNYKQLLVKFLFFSIALLYAFCANSQNTKCIEVNKIEKWEVLDSTKTIIYDSQGNSIAFIIFNSAAYLKKSGETFRFFSSAICRFDRVQTSQGMTEISNIEPIRK